MWYDQYIKDAENPDWSGFSQQFTHVHDWRTYVTEEVRASWDDIPIIGQCAIVACCEEMADNENWD